MFERYDPANYEIAWERLLHMTIVILVAIAIAWIVHKILFALLHRLSRLSDTHLDEMVFDKLERPLRWSMIAIGISLASQFDALLGEFWEVAGKFIVPALLGWVAYVLVKAFTYALEYKAEISDDPVAARSRKTRIAILSRTITFAIVFVTVGLMLVGIPVVREIGVTLVASAGLAALAVGAAAQPALKSLIAGLQMAITEPLRLGDLVVVDGHTGRVEEIRMSFVVVRIWDERAVIVPTSQFLDQSFENWSRQNEKLTGPVFLHLDPATDVEPIREEFLRFVATQELWDQRTAAALMTEAHPESIELRLAVSALTIGDLFTLRCVVREHMIGWLRKNMPDALIRHRLEVEAANARVAGN
ncbi:mechanosensitive ion channel [Altererythrobacter aurantiacus]|uniref:Mechanosensitive ion channel n=1 Tax=Parapontixanthobacter aurantiacus TaxID=1463599 RepID=A0A844ZGG2_9SPHN|nr:mechanosensitive ion channel domain-containing protein [Parapontixanthobacter aurantiacus]MXO86236.1 mechanosensitive ion channel [Parapontixanthobacter aurantiacus]